MQLRTIGGHTVSAIGLGGLPLSIEERPEEDRSIATIHAALDAGITFIDTADGDHREANGVSQNEELSARALRECGSGADGVLVATTGGQLDRHGAFQEVADEVGAGVYQVTLAWELALAPVVIPIARRLPSRQHP